MTPVDRYFSEKITRLSMLAAVMVVLLHATQMLCTDAVTHGSWLYRILTGPVTGWAVPFFFMVSGFWFGEKDVTDWRLFYGKKLKTLVVPYVLYAVIASVVTIPVLVLVNRQSGSPIWTSTIFAPGGLWSAVDGLIGITRQYGPVNAGYLWFVRALIVIFACAPVLKVVQHRLPYLLPAISLVLIFVPDMRRFVGIDTRVYYFFIGMGLAQCDVVPGRFGWRPLAVTGTLCVGVFVAWLLMGGAGFGCVPLRCHRFWVGGLRSNGLLPWTVLVGQVLVLAILHALFDFDLLDSRCAFGSGSLDRGDVFVNSCRSTGLCDGESVVVANWG